jgi:hypothetical protein
MRVERWSSRVAHPYNLFALPLDKSRPIGVGLVQISLGIFVEIASDTFAVLEQKPAVDDLKCFGIDFNQLVV